jgi:hypothetical protein
VAWGNRNIVRNNCIQKQCGLLKELNAAGMRKTRSAKVAWCGGHDGKRYGQVSAGQETKKRRKDEKTLRKHPECNKVLRDIGPRQQLQDPDTRRQVRVMIEKTSNEIFREKIAKRVVGTSSGLRKMWKWILRRGRPPPKRKKKLHTE